MIKFTMISIFLFASTSFAKIDSDYLKCQFDINGNSKKEIEVSLGYAANAKESIIQGHTVSVSFEPGDEYEPQQVLSMTLNGVTSSIYGPDKALYVMTEKRGRVRFQCWISKYPKSPF